MNQASSLPRWVTPVVVAAAVCSGAVATLCDIATPAPPAIQCWSASFPHRKGEEDIFLRWLNEMLACVSSALAVRALAWRPRPPFVPRKLTYCTLVPARISHTYATALHA